MRDIAWALGFDSLFTSSKVLNVTERLLISMVVAAMMGFNRPLAATGMLMRLYTIEVGVQLEI